MTGKYPIHLGMQHYVIVNTQPSGLPLGEKIFPQYLKDCGYETFLIGKWHLGFFKTDYTPNKRGFDHFYGFLGAREDHYTKEECQKSKFDDRDYCGISFHHNLTPDNSTFGQRSSKVYADYLIDKLNQKSSQNRFFLYSTHDPHEPNQVERKFLDLYEGIKEPRKSHLAMMSEFDNDFGRILDKVDMDNTIIIVSSDNGGETEYGGNNFPLRGQKWNFLQGGVRNIGFVYPDNFLGEVDEKIFHISDWMPTILSKVCNADVNNIDGVNQIRDIRNEILLNIDPLKKEPQFYSRFEEELSNKTHFDVRYEAAYLKDSYKLITGKIDKPERVSPPENEILISSTIADEENENLLHLFDIKNDPFELNNLAYEAKYQDLLQDMLTKMSEFNATSLPCHFPDHSPNAVPINGFWQPWDDDQ